MGTNPTPQTRIRSLPDLERIDRCLQHVIWVSLTTVGAYFFAVNRTSEIWVRAMIISTALVQIGVVYRLARALNFSKTLLIGRCLLCLVPTICLIGLVAMISDAKEVLKRRI
jgi:hypothetical protein